VRAIRPPIAHWTGGAGRCSRRRFADLDAAVDNYNATRHEKRDLVEHLKAL
jgi:hypothetical protein